MGDVGGRANLVAVGLVAGEAHDPVAGLEVVPAQDDGRGALAALDRGREGTGPVDRPVGVAVLGPERLAVHRADRVMSLTGRDASRARRAHGEMTRPEACWRACRSR